MEEVEFNVSKKRGSASEKRLLELKANRKIYDKIKEGLIGDARSRLGVDVLTEYNIPQDFDLKNLDMSVFQRRCLQKFFIPFSNEQISNFTVLPKYAIGEPFVGKVRGKEIYGTYLLGKENGKNLIFALSIVKGSKFNNDNTDISIKIDMLVSGKEWFQLSRFDSLGAGHPNYIVNGQVAHSLKFVEFAQTPHIHTNSEETQVLFSTESNCNYTLAKTVEELLELRNRSDESYFKICIDTFLRFSGVATKINDKISEKYNYSWVNPLFDVEEVKRTNQSLSKEYENTTKENLEEAENRNELC